jgi:hypothetical protein
MKKDVENPVKIDAIKSENLGKKEQKQLKLQRKAGKNPPTFELVQECKKMWEQFRIKQMSKEQRCTLISDTLSLVKGHILDVSLPFLLCVF